MAPAVSEKQPSVPDGFNERTLRLDQQGCTNVINSRGYDSLVTDPHEGAARRCWAQGAAVARLMTDLVFPAAANGTRAHGPRNNANAMRTLQNNFPSIRDFSTSEFNNTQRELSRWMDDFLDNLESIRRLSFEFLEVRVPATVTENVEEQPGLVYRFDLEKVTRRAEMMANRQASAGRRNFASLNDPSAQPAENILRMPAYSALYALKVQHEFGNCGLECATRAFQTATEILGSPAAISNFQEYASEPRSESPFRQAWANGCRALHNQARDRRDDRQNSEGPSAQLQIVSEGRADVGPGCVYGVRLSERPENELQHLRSVRQLRKQVCLRMELRHHPQARGTATDSDTLPITAPLRRKLAP